MTGYRRLISYIYAYEGEEKGKNIGFVKLESRNGQCRLSVNVKKIYAGGNDIGVYLIASGQEIPLGNIFIRKWMWRVPHHYKCGKCNGDRQFPG